MNCWQLLRRLKVGLQARRWGGSASGQPVFAPHSVVLTVAPSAEGFEHLVRPAVMLAPLDANRDPEFREAGDLLTQRISATLLVSVAGDDLGEFALMGGARQSAVQSAGRGLLEVEAELLAAIQSIGNGAGVTIQHVFSSALDARLEESAAYSVLRGYAFDALLNTFRSYDEARDFAGSVAAGAVSLSWAAPSDTTGLVSYVLRRISGSVPVATASEGTSVSLSTPLATSKSESPGAGTWSYSLFAGYDDLSGATPIYHSSPQTLTVLVT